MLRAAPRTWAGPVRRPPMTGGAYIETGAPTTKGAAVASGDGGRFVGASTRAAERRFARHKLRRGDDAETSPPAREAAWPEHGIDAPCALGATVVGPTVVGLLKGRADDG